MQVAQIPQRGSIIFTHPARKIRIIQPLISRRFRHILQHAQPLLNRLLAVRRHLFPFGQHVIPDMVPLVRRHPSPDLRALAKLLLLSRRQPPQSLFILREPLLFLRRHIPQTFLHVRRDNVRAIELYKRLGIAKRAVLYLAVITKT